MFLLAELDLILITLGRFDLLVLLRLLVELFPFVVCCCITTPLQTSLVNFRLESTLHLILACFFFIFLSSHKFSPLLMLVCLLKQVLTEPDWIGGHIRFVMGGLVDFRFEIEVIVQLFFGLIVFRFCATHKIVAVLGQSQVNFGRFLCFFFCHRVLTLVIQRSQEFSWSFAWRKVFVLGFNGVHPWETKILDGAHIDLRVLSLDLFFTLIRVLGLLLGNGPGKITPHYFKLRLVCHVWLSNEAHLKESFKRLSDRDRRFIRNVVVVIHLLQVAFKSFENYVLRISWHWLYFFHFLQIILHPGVVLLDLVSAFGVVSQDVFYFSWSNDGLWALVDLRLVGWLDNFGGLSAHWRLFDTT